MNALKTITIYGLKLDFDVRRLSIAQKISYEDFSERELKEELTKLEKTLERFKEETESLMYEDSKEFRDMIIENTKRLIYYAMNGDERSRKLAMYGILAQLELLESLLWGISLPDIHKIKALWRKAIEESKKLDVPCILTFNEVVIRRKPNSKLRLGSGVRIGHTIVKPDGKTLVEVWVVFYE